MKSSIKDQTELSASLDITIEKSDYADTFATELKKVQKNANMKGFRKGKTPKSMVMKMYGTSILSEVINKTIQDKLWEAIEEHKLNVILSPLISKDQKAFDFNPKDLQDYDFSFLLGLKPDFELKGIDKSDSIDSYVIVPDDETINKEFELVRKRLGSEVTAEKDITTEDRITIHANESNGKGGKKRGGWETGFQVLVSDIDDEYKEDILGKDTGYEFEFDIHKIEKNRDEAYVKKYLLNLDEEEEKEIGNVFKGKITEIHRIEPAEVNQEFFDKYLGEGVASSEDEVKAKIKENIATYYDAQSRAYLHRNIMDQLIAENKFDLSKEFVSEWAKRNNENLTQEQIDSEIDAVITNLKWELISAEIKEKLKFEVQPEDIKAKIRAQVQQYIGGQMPGMDLEPIVDNLMKDEKQFKQAYQEAHAEKLLTTVSEQITLVEQEVTIEKFGEMVKAMNERLQGGK